ncbi:MAG: hypothetical protein WA989_06070, partial [Henriciella sp.]|uniref:hypothetical protein n=1 Tax=Henriciella sp. TaxID=1968823 RepID=UPI003C73ECB9
MADEHEYRPVEGHTVHSSSMLPPRQLFLAAVLLLGIVSWISPAEANRASRDPAHNLENRVWDFFLASCVSHPENRLQAGESHQESCVAGTTGASGSLLFLQRDPEGYRDSVNLYAGMGWDTINLRDPTGRSHSTLEECVRDWPEGTANHLRCFEQYGQPEQPGLYDRFKAWIRGKGAEAAAPIGRAAGRHLVTGVANLGGVEAREGAVEEFEGRGRAAARSAGADAAELAAEAVGGKGLGIAAAPLMRINLVRKIRKAPVKSWRTGKEIGTSASQARARLGLNKRQFNTAIHDIKKQIPDNPDVAFDLK